MGTVVTERPKTIGIAAALLCVAFAIGIVLMGIRLDRSFNVPHALTYPLYGVTFALLALLTYQVFLGKNWARIVCVILVCARLVGSLPRAIGELSTSPLMGGVGLAAIVLQLLAIYLLFSGQGKAWFRRPAPRP